MGTSATGVGLGLGILIGVVSSANFIYMLRTLAKMLSWADGVKVVGEIAAIPTLWFGGPWITTKIITDDTWHSIAPSYVPALAAVFVLVTIYPLIRYIIRLGRDM
ncbi:MAG TPA: hypothetical protein VG206_14005 [Terriglobia bacterium]|nr:hypothetical protein [Terriglobia bacterium]